MKANALRIGKAMSAALFVLLLVVVGSKNALAQNQVATLQHGDDISAFYGQNAFVEAHTAAQTGDIITLSSGTFVPCDITKAITLRGAGCAIDLMANTNPTSFGGEIMFNVSDTIEHLTIEGILFTLKVCPKELHNAEFVRCSFVNFDRNLIGASWNMYDSQFVNCIIDQFNFYSAKNTVLINSVVWRPKSVDGVSLYNSILKCQSDSYAWRLWANNSIIIGSSSNYFCPRPDCSFIKCIGIISNGNPFGEGYTLNCITYTSYEEVFESFTGEFSLDEPFILKDEIATGFLGTDGTQVGIYGGSVPYSNIPGYMLRTNVSVPNRSNIDGTLNVEIEVIDDDQ